MTTKVTIKDVGPIHQLSIPVPPEGGIVVLTGRNGAGKSEALAATEKLIRGTGSLTKRDRCLTSGVVQGFGATIKVGAKTTRSGELEVTSLEDRLHVSDLVDPQIKDPDAADAKRIKALVSLSGVAIDPQSFYLGFEKVVAPAIRNVADPIESAALAKRALEAEARVVEASALNNGAMAQAAQRAIEGVDLTAESDTRKLQESHTEAVKEHTRLVSQKAEAGQAELRREAAERNLSKLVAGYTGLTVEAAIDRVTAAALHMREANTAVKEAEEVLRTAKARRIEMEAAHNHAAQLVTAAKGHAATIAQFRATIEQTTAVAAPSDMELIAASQAVDAASKTIEQGVIVRTARAEHDNLTAYRVTAKEQEKKAMLLRDAAAKIDFVLSKAVPCDELRVENGRLVTDTEERGPTFYGDLSVGQRWKIALRIAIAAVGEHGVLVIPQEAWEGLDPDNRRLIADEVAGRKVTIITAEPSTGELRAEVYGDGF